MPCDAVATFRARLATFADLDLAIQSFTPEQATNFCKALLDQLIPNNQDCSILKTTYSITLTKGSIRMIVRLSNNAPISLEIIDWLGDYYAYEFDEITKKIRGKTIQAATLLKKQSAINKIIARYGANIQTAPNNSTILTLDI